MAYAIRKVDVWVGDVLNRPGILARLLEALADAGAQLEFLVGRRITERTSRVFVAPLKGKRQLAAAEAVGLVRAAGMHSLRVEGPDRRGLGGAMARAIATAGINIRGVSAAVVGRRMVFYLAFKQVSELAAAAKVLRKALGR